MPLPDLDELPPHLAPGQTSWPLPGQQHVGALRGPDGWEVTHWGPGFSRRYGIWAEDPATATAYALWRLWDTVQNIPLPQMRKFFQPQATA